MGQRSRRNPRGRLLEFPLREFSVEAFPFQHTTGWMLNLHINNKNIEDVVRDPKTGVAKSFKTKTAAVTWWKRHGQAFTNALGRVACVRTRKANPSGRRQAAGGRKKRSGRTRGRGRRSVLERGCSVRARRSARSMRNTLSPRQANPATPEEIYRLAALTGRQWKRVAEKARKGDPAAAAAVELRRRMGELRRERERRRYGAAGTGRYDWDYGPAALKRRAASRRERTAIETAVRRWTECPAARYWSKTQLQRVRDAARYAAQGIGGDPESAAARATIDAMVRRMVKRGWQRRHTSKEGGRATSRYLRKGDFEVRLSDHRVPQTAQREYRGPAGWYDFDELDPCGDVEAQIDYIERYAEGARRRGNYSASRSPRRSARGVVDDLFDDPSLSGPAMQKHLRAIKARAGSAARRSSRGATAEWEEFAGYSPNHVEEIDGVALSGNLPGVRVDVLKGVGQKTGRAVEIDASKKALWLVWFNSGERFALTGGPSAMRELARDFARLREPVILTQVDYVALRNPVPEGVRRTKANADWAAAFTHAVENPTVLSWNGKSDPRKARFDIRVQGRRRRWVNRSGLIF